MITAEEIKVMNHRQLIFSKNAPFKTLETIQIF